MDLWEFPPIDPSKPSSIKILLSVTLGSSSQTNFELLTAFQRKSELVPANEKGHTLFGYGLE
jgi:hypothetical protein